MHNGRQSMGDDDHCSSLETFLDGLCDQRIHPIISYAPLPLYFPAGLLEIDR